MNNKFKDGVGSSKRYNKQELKTIKVAVRRKDIPESNSPVPLQRDLDNPEDLLIHVRHGEGQRPIFDRDDIRVNEEFKKRIILTEPEQSSSEHGKSSLLQSENWRRTNRSPSRSSSVSTERDYARKRKYSSRERSVSPLKKTFETHGSSKEHKDDEYNRFGPRTLKVADEIKKPDWKKKSRSRSPHLHLHHKAGPSSFSKENQYREYPSSRKAEYRRSRSRERERERERERRSLSAEKREHYSKRNRSPNRRETYSPPHRSETHRDSSFAEYRSRKRTPSPSPYKYKPADLERYRRRSRSSSRTRQLRSRSPYRSDRYHHETSRRRSPHRSETHRADYRKRNSRSPSRHERYKERSSRRYSRSPSREDRRYRRSPPRNRRRSPSPYKERHDRYHPLPPPHLAPGPVVPINYGPQWYPWPQPLGPRFIPPIRMQRPPFPPVAPIVAMGQRPRPPIIYNNRSTKITLVNKTPSITEAAAPVSTSDLPATSTAVTAPAGAINAITPAQLEGSTAVACESTVNSTISVESSSKEP